MTSFDEDHESEPAYTKSIERSKYPFYHPNIDNKLVPQIGQANTSVSVQEQDFKLLTFTSQTRELLDKYSHIPPEQQSAHVHKVRDKAWNIRAYPCIGLGAFLIPDLCRLPVYPKILTRVKSGQLLMEVGTFLGHDLRRLVLDGAPSANLYGIDIVNHWDMGFEMFRDKDHFKAHFIESDILATHPALELLKGKVDIVAISKVLHQWAWDGQVNATKVLTTFTKPGSIIAGNQIGNVTAGEIAVEPLGSRTTFRHNLESFEKMWNQVGSETGTKWKVQAWLRTFEEMSWDAKDAAWLEEGVRAIEFAVERIE